MPERTVVGKRKAKTSGQPTEQGRKGNSGRRLEGGLGKRYDDCGLLAAGSNRGTPREGATEMPWME
jgi:hypothetical protein